MMALALEVALKGSVVIAACSVLVLLLRTRGSAAWRHAICLLAASSLLVLPIMSVALPAWEVPIEVAPNAPAAKRSADGSGVSLPSTSIGGSPLLASDTAAAPEPTAAGPIPWMLWLAAIYVAGVVTLLTRLVVALLSMRRLARRARVVTDPGWIALLRECENKMRVARPVRLLRSIEQIMPMAFGIGQPAILIPAVADTWSDDRRRAVLLHEMAHVARRDCLTQLTAAVAVAVYWPHPGVWWLVRRIRVERELACDDRVLSIGTGARAYAEHLLELAYALGGSPTPALAVGMARPRELEGRMFALLDAARNRATPARRSALISLAGVLAIVMPLAAAETVPMEPPPPATTSTVSSPATNASAQRTPVRTDDERRSQERPSRELGTWELRPSRQDGRVNLRIVERRDSSRSFTIELDRLEGLTNAMLSGGRADLRFSLKRDGGTFEFDGVFRSGVGAGTYTFTPSNTYAAELVRRGYERPTTEQQYALALGDVGFTFLDELTRQRYATPDINTLVRASNHGVHDEYLREMGAAGYRLGQLDPLIRMRDHGVDPEFIKGLGDYGLSGITADDLVRARDHGVDPEYVRALRSHGYDRLSIEQLITARDHGVDGEYVGRMRELGFKLTIEELRNARDHGVDPQFVQGMIKQGYKSLSIGELVRLRDHGVDPEWVRRQNSRRREAMTVDELIWLRDRGGDL